MGKLLNVEEGKHLIQKYSLKPLYFDDKESKDDEVIEEKKEEYSEGINLDEKPIVSNNIDNSFVEDLLKKSDELSTQILNIQQQINQQSQDCKNQLLEIKTLSHKDGFNEGYNKAKAENENEIKERVSKLIESISKVEEVYKEYQSKAENIEKELVGVAMDIAEQVIAKELSKSSKEIALSLTKELINDIKEATKIEIKINPLDYEYVKENLQLEKVKITPDNAITPGGVVILSDAGNIEAEIHERFKTIKENILKG
jgi:flagellar assembly protein FliH